MRRALMEVPPLVYAIGDIHGCFRELIALEARIRADAHGSDGALLVYLGDYIDRGPDSRAVLDHLCRTHGDGIERIMLCGNHDDAFLRFIRNPRDNMGWLEFGGDATLRSYGIDPMAYLNRGNDIDALGSVLREIVPQSHVDLLENLPVYLLCGDHLFVHAGIRPRVALGDQDDADLMWIREPFLTEGPGLALTVVHGHTAGKEPVFHNGRICIDTGCYATGRLTALRITPAGAAVL
jgi:serine/threonine protein phosphatase 1